MRILVLTNLFPPHHAGVNDFRCEWITNTFRQRGHEVKVLTSKHGLMQEQLADDIDRRLVLNGAFGHERVENYGGLKEIEKHNNAVLRETIQEYQPDLIHVYSLRGLSKSVMFTLRASNKPVVYDVADGWLAYEIAEDPWLKWWNAPGINPGRSALEMAGGRGRMDKEAPTRLMRGYDRLPQLFGSAKERAAVEPASIGGFQFERLYFISQTLKEQTVQAGFRVGHGEVIYPGVAAEVFYAEPKPQSAPIKKFLILGNLAEGSGLMTALEGLKVAKQHGGAGFTLTICGKGDSEFIAKTRSFALNQQLTVEFVQLPREPKEFAALYRAHDAFLYTSEIHEPFAIPPLHAMASGLPVIASNAGGLAEVLRHGDNALLFTPGDATECGSRLQELQMQPALRRQMAERAQADVMEHFNESTLTDRVEACLNLAVETWDLQ